MSLSSSGSSVAGQLKLQPSCPRFLYVEYPCFKAFPVFFFFFVRWFMYYTEAEEWFCVLLNVNQKIEGVGRAGNKTIIIGRIL